MKFEEQVIGIAQQGCKDRLFIRAFVGVGSGLAYHHPESLYGTDISGYTLTHVASGLCIGGDYLAEFHTEARRWLELVSKMTDWNVDHKQLIKSFDAADIKKRIEDALEQACEEVERETMNAE